MPYHKKLPIISYSAFLKKVVAVDEFTSSQGKRYLVENIIDETLHFKRLDAGGSKWDIDLKKLYQAYIQLDIFHTRDFLPYVPRKHSPGRGLLLHLGLIC